MAEKVNRHNHPIMVKARHDAYFEGKKDGFKEGYESAAKERKAWCNMAYEAEITCLKEIIKALERSDDLSQNEECSQ